MKYTLADQVQSLIAAYNENSAIQGEAISAILEPFKDASYANRFTPDGLRKTIDESITAITADWTQYDKLLNQKLNVLLEATADQVKKDPSINTADKPSDYAVRIANARAFLKVELDDVSDVDTLDKSMHFILADFSDDFNTMKLFKKMVERQHNSFYNANGKVIFPDTFGKFCKAEDAMNALRSMNTLAESLFMQKRTPGADININGSYFGVPFDSYTYKEDVANIMKNAAIFDDMMNSISTTEPSQD